MNHQIENNIKIANQWIKAFNEHNTDSILLLYNDNAIHFSPKLKIKKPETNGFIKGKNEMRIWWDDSFERLPTLHYELTNCIANEHQLVIEYKRTVEKEKEMMIAEILEIEHDLIVKSRVYHT